MCIICSHCEQMPTAVECVCCDIIDQCQNVTDQSVSAGSIQCITEHKGFEAVCIKYVGIANSVFFISAALRH